MESQNLTFRGASFTVCRVDLTRDDLRLFWRKPDTNERFASPGRLAHWLKDHGSRLQFATNAGIFAPGRTPLGLYIEEGVRKVPLNLSDGSGNFYLKPGGVFAVSGKQAVIVESSRFGRLTPPSPIRLATQSGPLLLQAGRLHPAFRADSANRTLRNGVGVLSPTHTAFAISNAPVNFYDFALLFRDYLKCRDALYLDGGISRLYCPRLQRFDTGGDFAALFGVVSHA